MKLSLTLHNKTYSVESDEVFDGTDVYELAEQFKGLLVNAGFHPSNVDSIFDLDYQWFTEEERNDNLQGHLKEDLSLHSRAIESSKHDYLAERAKELYQDDPEIELPE